MQSDHETATAILNAYTALLESIVAYCNANVSGPEYDPDTAFNAWKQVEKCRSEFNSRFNSFADQLREKSLSVPALWPKKFFAPVSAELGFFPATALAAFDRLTPFSRTFHDLPSHFPPAHEPAPALPVPADQVEKPTNGRNVSEPTAASMGTTPEGSQLPDDFAELRKYAKNNLKGQERAVIEALCDSKGELPIDDLAVADGVGWQDWFQGFKDCKRRLNPKLKKRMFSLSCHDNAARLLPIEAPKRG